jgi:hypothetical protein
MGLGFTLAIVLLGAIRQGLTALGLSFFTSSAGGFLVFGLVMAAFNKVVSAVKDAKFVKSVNKEGE